MPEVSENQRSGGRGLLSIISGGDWLKVPGAVKAIGRVVAGVGNLATAGLDIGTAKLEQVSHRIREDTAAERAVSTALARAAAKAAAKDPALVSRSLARWVQSESRAQANREAVAQIAADHLSEGPASENIPDEPADDWLNRFERLAEEASSEKLRETLGRILAGEIRRPGAFSYRALHFVSLVDQRIATLVDKVAARVVNGEFIILTSQMQSGKELAELGELESLGYLKTDLNIPLEVDPNKSTTIRYKRKAIILCHAAETRRSTHLEIALLTEMGKSIHSILDYDDDTEHLRSVALTLKKALGGKAYLADLAKGGLENMLEVVE
jgi:hypothetical protein